MPPLMLLLLLPVAVGMPVVVPRRCRSARLLPLYQLLQLPRFCLLLSLLLPWLCLVVCRRRRCRGLPAGRQGQQLHPALRCLGLHGIQVLPGIAVLRLQL